MWLEVSLLGAILACARVEAETHHNFTLAGTFVAPPKDLAASCMHRSFPGSPRGILVDLTSVVCAMKAVWGAWVLWTLAEGGALVLATRYWF